LQVNTALNQQQLRKVSAADQKDRSEIRAPYSGTIEKSRLPRSAMWCAEPIMEIVPDHDVMVVEASIDPTTSTRSAWARPRVRFTAFNRAATPEIPGRVIYVATDRTDNQETRQAFYTVRIAVDQAAIAREGLPCAADARRNLHRDRQPLAAVLRRQAIARPVHARLPRQLNQGFEPCV
jgi:HlyD family secretion protein